MDWPQIIILALVQGITEFLPVSSSAHLILVPHLFGWQDQGLAFDVAVHLGTLGAVLWYFRHELIPLYKDWHKSLLHKKQTGDSMLAWGVLAGTLPVGLAGLLIHDFQSQLRLPLVIATTTILFALALWYADARNRKTQNHKSEHQLSWAAILAIGLAQALALIPGTSRSGITMTMALLLGYSRTASARFSFLLSIPVIILASTLEIIKLVQSEQAIDWQILLSGMILSAVSAYFCIVYFIKMLQALGMLPFVIYRLILGFVLLLFFVV